MKINSRIKSLLYELSKNARLPATQIAKRTKMSKDVAVYTLNKLTKENIVSFMTLLNTEKLGFTRYELYFQLMNEEKKAEFIQYLSNHPMFIWVRSSMGDWEILTEFYAENIVEQERILREINTKYGKYIKKMNFVTVLNESSFPLKQIGGVEEEQNINRVENKEVDLDKNDVLIMEKLSINARINIIDLARITKLSPDAVTYRMKNLIKNNLILNYRVILYEKILGLEKFKILLKLKNIDEKTHSKLFTFLKMQKSTQYIKKCIGRWDFSITVLAHDVAELRDIVSEIKRNLDFSLEDYKILLMFEEYKNTYFPKGVVERLLGRCDLN